MRKILLAASAVGLFLVFNACSKSDSSTSNAKTVANLSGSYNLTALVGTVSGSNRQSV